MRILDARLNEIREDVLSMMQLVELQLHDSIQLFTTYDEGKVIDVKKREKKVDKFDTKINRKCERFLAVCTPVADDLRTIMTINNMLPSVERISDIAEKIAKYFKKYPQPIDSNLIKELQIIELMSALSFMYNSVLESFANSSTLKLHDVFIKDHDVNKLYKDAKQKMIGLLHEPNANSEQMVNLLLIVSKLERVGDHIKTIAEEISFGVDGVFLRHKHE